jgi:uncharacterized protein YcbK (DUF882 family)
MANPTHPNFSPNEFACQCGKCGKGFAEMRAPTLTKLYNARDAYGKPMKITSAFRCVEHNSNVSKAKNSSHLRGRAVDIKYNTMQQGLEILQALLDAGFPRVGIKYSAQIIHADDDPTLPSGLIPY